MILLAFLVFALVVATLSLGKKLLGTSKGKQGLEAELRTLMVQSSNNPNIYPCDNMDMHISAVHRELMHFAEAKQVFEASNQNDELVKGMLLASAKNFYFALLDLKMAAGAMHVQQMGHCQDAGSFLNSAFAQLQTENQQLHLGLPIVA